jgi:thiamine biosynthesis lipoprotein
MMANDAYFGGCVWEMLDHSVDIGKPGAPKYIYGGDKGNYPHDGNFCVDGLLYPDRRPHTGMLELKQVLRPCRAEAFDAEKGSVTLTDPEMKLDVGAVAKGYATECIARHLETQGITGYILNVGGNIRAVGAKADGESWAVGIENPNGGDYLEYLNIRGQSVVTSGSYQRYYYVDGKAYHHIIHPDTLMPADNFVSVSVICKDSGFGDAMSTALFCLSLEEGLKLVESVSGLEAMWLTHDGEKTVSSGWNEYVKK